MGKKKTTPITINNTEYVLEDMTSEQQLMINHVSDLNRKRSIEKRLDEGSARFKKSEMMLWGIYPLIIGLFLVERL